jgi:hypothetical protein
MTEINIEELSIFKIDFHTIVSFTMGFLVAFLIWGMK